MYLDGFIVPVPTDKIDIYKTMAEGAANAWMDHGALAYREMLLDPTDPPNDFCTTFPAIVKPHEGETVVFAYILFRNKAHRDEVNAKVMKDPRMDPAQFGESPFDCKRMAYNGFTPLVEYGTG